MRRARQRDGTGTVMIMLFARRPTEHYCWRPPDGDVEAELKIGQPYFRNEGVEHNVINVGASELVFIEVELKKE